MTSHQRFEILSLLVQNVLISNSKSYQIHGDKQIIAQVLPTAPERAYISNDCYDSSNDLGSIPYTDVLQRLLRLGFQIASTTSGSYVGSKIDKSIQQHSSQDTFVLQYTLLRNQTVS